MFLPDDGVFEAQLCGGLLDLLLQPRLRAHQVLDKLGHPPDGGVAMQTVQAWGQVLRDSQGQVWGPRVEAVHYRQLHNLDVLIMGLSCMGQRGTCRKKDTQESILNQHFDRADLVSEG